MLMPIDTPNLPDDYVGNRREPTVIQSITRL